MRNWIRLATINNKKPCCSSMIRLQVQAIQCLDQKHSEVCPAFFLPLVCMYHEMTINCTVIIFWIGTLTHWSAQSEWCSLNKCSELSHFVFPDLIPLFFKITYLVWQSFKKNPDPNRSKLETKIQQPEAGTQPEKV